MGHSTTSSPKQVGGTHYTNENARCPHCEGIIQHWDLYATSSHLVGSATKYLTRFDAKHTEIDGQIEDILKGISYAEKMLSILQARKRRTEERVRTSAEPHSDYHAPWPYTPDEPALDVEAEAARQRAEAYAHQSNHANDVPVGWALEEVNGFPGWWHYRFGQGGYWYPKVLGREKALEALLLLLNKKEELIRG